MNTEYKTTDTEATDALRKAQFFWEEYKYRHDHIWQRIISFTVAIVLISIMPYIQQEIVCILKYGILIVPVLAFILACFVFSVMRNELKLFGRIKKAYQQNQNEFLEPASDDDSDDSIKQTTFDMQVKIYFGSLVLLTIINGLMVGLIWIPKVLVLLCH